MRYVYQTLRRLAYLSCLLALKYYTADGLGPTWYGSLIFIVAFFILESVAETRSAFSAWIYSARFATTAIASTASITLGAIVIMTAPLISFPTPIPLTINQLIPPLLHGIILGLMLRVLLTAYFKNIIKSNTIRLHKFSILVLVSFVVILLPPIPADPYRGGLFLIGIGAGFYIHYAIRTQEHSRARQARLLQNIITSALAATHAELTLTEASAVRRFAKQQRWRLNHIFTHSKALSPTLQLIRAAQLRLRGQYIDALDVLDKLRHVPGIDQDIEALIRLHQALNYGDNGDDERMCTALSQAEAIRPDCLLTQVTFALREAEQISFTGAASPAVDPLSRMRKAVAIYEQRPPNKVLGLILGTTVPFTWTSILDAYGYVLLKTGRPRLSRSFLLHCVYDDPTFSSPYLHLGEWFLMDYLKAREKKDHKTAVNSRYLAKICLRISIAFERRRQSRIRQRAEELFTHCV